MNFYNEHNPHAAERFGSLIVKSVRKGRKNVHPTAECVCDCGATRIARLTRLRRGHVNSCASCSRKAAWDLRGRLNDRERHTSDALQEYRENAKRKQISFELSRRECGWLFHSPCHYCGYAEGPVGIDRIDNKVGYRAGNVAPCCRQCNYAKRDMPVADFLAWVKRIAEHQGGMK